MCHLTCSTARQVWSSIQRSLPATGRTTFQAAKVVTTPISIEFISNFFIEFYAGNTAGPTAGPTQVPDTTTTTAAPTTTTTTASPTTSGPFVCPQPDGTFANPNDCSSYYSCSNSVPVIMVSDHPPTLSSSCHRLLQFPELLARPGLRSRQWLLQLARKCSQLPRPTTHSVTNSSPDECSDHHHGQDNNRLNGFQLSSGGWILPQSERLQILLPMLRRRPLWICNLFNFICNFQIIL